MSDAFGARTLKRKNVKGLALNKPPPRPAAPPEPSQQAATDIDDLAGRTQQLEIGIEYKLDLKREDLEVLKELGSGNGGTVSKVRHIATGTIMARKVRYNYWSERFSACSDRNKIAGHPRRGQKGSSSSYRSRASYHARM